MIERIASTIIMVSACGLAIRVIIGMGFHFVSFVAILIAILGVAIFKSSIK